MEQKSSLLVVVFQGNMRTGFSWCLRVHRKKVTKYAAYEKDDKGTIA
jgi:hypothetical protein